VPLTSKIRITNKIIYKKEEKNKIRKIQEDVEKNPENIHYIPPKSLQHNIY